MSRRPHIVIFNPDQWRGDVLAHMDNPAAVTPANTATTTIAVSTDVLLGNVRRRAARYRSTPLEKQRKEK